VYLSHFVDRELTETEIKNVVTMIGNETAVSTDRGDVLRFTYDYSFWSFDESTAHYSSQSDVYHAIGQPLLSKVLEGYNACLLAYGQTGSGKSYRLVILSVRIAVIICYLMLLKWYLYNNSLCLGLLVLFRVSQSVWFRFISTG